MSHCYFENSFIVDLKILMIISISSTDCAEEVKGIEFTVTTLNCTQDQSNVVPEHRRKFSSLRKTGALSKAVRSKISKSFYSNSSNSKIEKAPNVEATTNSEKSCDVNLSGKDKAIANVPDAAQHLAVATTNKNDRSEKHKKRSKLCQLL